jgi:hypothetical protein
VKRTVHPRTHVAAVNYRWGHFGHLLVSIGSFLCQKSNFLAKMQPNYFPSLNGLVRTLITN